MVQGKKRPGECIIKAPSHAVPHAARWRRPRHALRPQHAARSSARLPKHGAVGRRAVHGRRRRRVAKQWVKEACQRGGSPRRPREEADYLNQPLVAGCRRCEAPDRPAAGYTGETGRRSSRRAQSEAARESKRRCRTPGESRSEATGREAMG
eukprot:scaffold61029_cov73-Phaeocystis_antarctica.AAC.1